VPGGPSTPADVHPYVTTGSETLSELRYEVRHRVVLHQKRFELFFPGDHEIDRLVELFTREIHGTDEPVGGRRKPQVVVIALDGRDMELPRLPPVDQSQAFLVGLDLLEVDLARKADVLFHPRILNRASVDPVQPLGQITERTVYRALDIQDMRDLTLVQDALLNQNLTDANPLHKYLVENNIVCIGQQLRSLR
jgi:hypothetical protein